MLSKLIFFSLSLLGFTLKKKLNFTMCFKLASKCALKLTFKMCYKTYLKSM